MNIKYYLSNATQSLVTTSLILAVIATMFFMVEPSVGRAVAGTPFTIKQTITDEISFLVQAPNVTMVGALQGITGGTANGSTTAVVRTNSAGGYVMSIAFATTSSGNAMRGDVSLSSAIHDYPATALGEPTYLFSTASTSAVFGYTASAADSADLDSSFINDGNDCNEPGSHTADRCWMEPMTTGFQIIDRGSSAALGATTTVHFRVHVPNSPIPALEEDVYTATATLTATNQ
ncbi:MAG TPA: hypothetical protein PKA42_01070 [Candidatus Paceibacterota bacterium]|nr:hypothetical protein [Candidatus Paceibacterota bacterium]HMO82734.1 hypothetical protein [Candidatus Paceibacterota bacterium]